jgi:parvulin-like peptidyl-prolyl isomerase
MTSRSGTSRRSGSSWAGRDRRNLYLNIGFGLVILVAALILGAAAFATWYGQHLSPVASVNGQAITRDDLTQRVRVEAVRLDITSNRLQTEHSAGRLSNADFQQLQQSLEQAQQQLASTALEHLIDDRIEAQLASQEGVTVTPEQIDAKLTEEATNPDERHVWVIEVKPKVDAGKTQPTATQKAAAKKTADDALADLNANKDWVEVSKARSTASGKDTGGDLGWLTKESTQIETPLRDAAFGLQPNGHTNVIEGEDGTFRIARVTEIVAGSVDATYQQQITDKGLSLDDYKAVLKGDLVRQALTDKVKQQALQPGPQRHVQAIYLKEPVDSQSGEPVTPSATAVKVRHILYAPNDDAQAAASLKPDDAAWKKAEDDARAAYTKLKADPSLFPQMARDESDDTGSGASGGNLGYVEKDSPFVKEFLDAIFKDGVQPGQILEPVKSQFGWHVIQVLSRGSDDSEAADIQQQLANGADFPKLAKEYSDGPEAKDGGDLGWVDHGERRRDLHRQGPRRGDTDPGGRPEEDPRERCVHQLVCGEEEGVHHHPRIRHLDRQLNRLIGATRCSTRSSAKRGSGGGLISPPASR